MSDPPGPGEGPARRGDAARRLLAFALLPALGVASPLLVLPAITTAHGAEGFAAVAVGQATGTALAVVVEIGWGLTGPHAAATASAAQRQRLVWLSLGTRLAAFLLAGPLGLVVAGLSVGTQAPAAALSALAASAYGLSLNWFFIGTGRPRAILLSDALPRVLASLVAAGVLLAGAPLWTYPVLQLLALALGLAVAVRLSGAGRQALGTTAPSDYRRSARDQASATVGRGFSAVYLALPTLVVNAVVPSAVPLFAAVDRMVRLLLALLASVPNALQSWLGAGHAAGDLGRRLRRALALNAGLGLLAGGAFAVTAPYAATVLFSGVVEPGLTVTALGGGVVLLTCLSRATGTLGLVHLRAVGWLTASAAFGAVLGLPIIGLLAGQGGAAGALVGVLLAEALVLAVQLVGLWRVRARRRRA